MNGSVTHPVSASHSETQGPGKRMQNESAKAFQAFCVFRDLGYERTLQKVANELQKSYQLVQRWGKRFNWHHRTADWDQYQDEEMQRELFARRARARKRALDIADVL